MRPAGEKRREGAECRLAPMEGGGYRWRRAWTVGGVTTAICVASFEETQGGFVVPTLLCYYQQVLLSGLCKSELLGLGLSLLACVCSCSEGLPMGPGCKPQARSGFLRERKPIQS